MDVDYIQQGPVEYTKTVTLVTVMDEEVDSEYYEASIGKVAVMFVRTRVSITYPMSTVLVSIRIQRNYDSLHATMHGERPIYYSERRGIIVAFVAC